MHNRAFSLSVGVALLAVFIVHSYVTSSEQSFREMYGQQDSVIVAKKDIRELDALDETNLTIRAVPHDFVEPGASKNMPEFRGALAIAPIMAGEQITRSKVTVPGGRQGLAPRITPGKRAITVKINDDSGVAKLLKPGDRVDVVATIDPSGSGNKTLLESRVILQDRLVLATGKYVTNTTPGIFELDPYKTGSKTKISLAEYSNYSNITLEVDAGQMLTLIYAAKNLDIYLALRNNDDTGEQDFGKIMMKDLMNREPAAMAPPPPKGPSATPGKH